MNTDKNMTDWIRETIIIVRHQFPTFNSIDDDDIARLWRKYSEEVAGASWLHPSAGFVIGFNRWATTAPIDLL